MEPSIVVTKQVASKFNVWFLRKLHLNDQIELYYKTHSCCLPLKIIKMIFGFYHDSWKLNFQVHSAFKLSVSFHGCICPFFFFLLSWTKFKWLPIERRQFRTGWAWWHRLAVLTQTRCEVNQSQPWIFSKNHY